MLQTIEVKKGCFEKGCYASPVTSIYQSSVYGVSNPHPATFELQPMLALGIEMGWRVGLLVAIHFAFVDS